MKEINYDEIDPKCRPMVKFFNEQGLTTKFCCQGHDNSPTDNAFYIMFDDSVSDAIMENFIMGYSNIFNHSPFLGSFMKWIRKMDGSIVYNWEYRVSYSDCAKNQFFADKDLKIMRIQNAK